MKTLLLTTCLSLFTLFQLNAQETLRDSILGERGISGTLDFRPEYRLRFTEYDDQGRLFEEIREEVDARGDWHPIRRRRLEYTGGELTLEREQRFHPTRAEWVDSKLETFQYQEGELERRLRQKNAGNGLTNDRRWSYDRNELGLDTLALQEQWNGVAWENLSRLLTNYAPTGLVKMQLLQVWRNGNWQNVRRRQQQYQQDGSDRAEQTIVQVWSLDAEAWTNQSRQTMAFKGNRWTSSRYENWDETKDEWVNANRRSVYYDNNNQPRGQLAEVWNGEWQNSGRAEFQFQDRNFLTHIQEWQTQQSEWVDFLRYRLEYNDDRKLARRTGMQYWNPETKAWENRPYSMRLTHFWSAPNSTSVGQGFSPLSCAIPNPYPIGTPFTCPDISVVDAPVQLEVVDNWGRTVHRSTRQPGQSLSINEPLPPGLYVLRLHEGSRLTHLQKLIIH